MSFHEKSNLAMLAILIGVYGWYFGTAAGSILGGGLAPEAALAVTNVKMLLTVVIIVVVSIVAHILIAIMAPSEANEAADERDKLIEMRGDQRGGFVLGVFALLAMGIAMLGQPAYLIANTILAGLVAGEVVKAVSKLIDYRRGV
ncbi:hypothetical protein [Maricaulis sp.]|uniref:hypothetical protein n=1 Tax=Maricaulis sp. TaxID=1486257 RepID=UPI00262C3C88|nr:hypothetical protein [Maricaulis sp.]